MDGMFCTKSSKVSSLLAKLFEMVD